MKRFILGSILCLVTILVFTMSDAMAIGLGVYFSGSSGSSDWTAEDDYNNSWDFETDTSHAGFGFVLDTAVAKNRVFNYRLNLGYERYRDESHSGGNKLEMNSFAWSNTFGFGVLRTRNVRLWLGPQLSFSYSNGSPDYNKNADVNLLGIGIAPVLGVNINLGKVVTLSFDGGYKIKQYFGTGEYSGSSSSNPDVTYDVSEGMPFLNFSVIFRIGDMY